MNNKIILSFSKEKYNLFSHILSVICDDKIIHWQENQIGIKFTQESFFIKEKDMSQSILLYAEFPKNSFNSNSHLEDKFVMFDTTRFLNGLKYCNRVKEKYDDIEVSFLNEKIRFLSSTQSFYQLRTNYNGKLSQFGNIDLPIELEDVSIEDFNDGLFLVNLSSNNDTTEPILAPVKIVVKENHAFIESTSYMNLSGGQNILNCRTITPSNISAEISLSEGALRFISKLGEKVKKMNFYFGEETVFKTKLIYDNDITVDVSIARQTE
jgi:hypothetical protein